MRAEGLMACIGMHTAVAHGIVGKPCIQRIFVGSSDVSHGGEGFALACFEQINLSMCSTSVWVNQFDYAAFSYLT